jgi:hypothetical protein
MTSQLNKLARFNHAKSIISNDIEAARVSNQYLNGLQRLPNANSATYSYLFQRRRKSFTAFKNRFKRSSLTDRPTLMTSDDVLLNKRSSLAPALSVSKFLIVRYKILVTLLLCYLGQI